MVRASFLPFAFHSLLLQFGDLPQLCSIPFYNSLGNCVSLTCSRQCCRLVEQRPCHVLSCLCDNVCKRSLAICHKRRALCPVCKSLSVPIQSAGAEQGRQYDTNKQQMLGSNLDGSLSGRRNHCATPLEIIHEQFRGHGLLLSNRLFPTGSKSLYMFISCCGGLYAILTVIFVKISPNF